MFYSAFHTIPITGWASGSNRRTDVLGDVFLPGGQHRDATVPHNVLGDATDEDVRQAGTTVRAHDDEVGAFGLRHV